MSCFSSKVDVLISFSLGFSNKIILNNNFAVCYSPRKIILSNS